MNARVRRAEIEKRLKALKEFADTFTENTIEMKSSEVGIITAGMAIITPRTFFLISLISSLEWFTRYRKR